MLRKMAERGEDEDEDDEDEDEDEDEGDEEKEGKDDYMNFWNEFSKSIKMGVVQDRKNKSKLAKLLRYQTSKSNGKEVSLGSYVDRMKDDQKQIYYITGESIDILKVCP